MNILKAFPIIVKKSWLEATQTKWKGANKIGAKEKTQGN